MIAELLNRIGVAGQFAPVWTAEDLCSPNRCPSLSAEDFRLVHKPDGAPVACAAIWDQRAVKQVVVRGYAPWLRRIRPWINFAACLTGGPRLPAVGGAIDQAFVSHLAATDAEVVRRLVELLHGPAWTRKIHHLVFGFDARDPRLPALRRAFRPREYVSRLYAVYWDETGAAIARRLDDRLLAPEAASL